MSDLLNLADRVEASTGADRELDAAIWLACVPGATRNELRYFHKATGKECVIDETRDASGRLIIVPEYLGSLDAAMTLVPAGYNWALTKIGNSFDAVLNCHPVSSTAIVGPHLASPARAITAASLRAIHARGCADGEEGNV